MEGREVLDPCCSLRVGSLSGQLVSSVAGVGPISQAPGPSDNLLPAGVEAGFGDFPADTLPRTGSGILETRSRCVSPTRR